MKRASLAAAFAACLLATIPAHAQEHPYALKMSGGEFLSLCTNPPEDPGTVFAMCQMYVAGIADTLKSQGNACFPAWLTQRKLFATAAWWINSRPRENYPASIMIRNGLLKAYRCPIVAQRRGYVGPSDAQLEHDRKVIALWAEATKFLLLFAH
jgi:hypothetical protein